MNVSELFAPLTEMKNGGKFFDKNGKPKDVENAFAFDYDETPDNVMKSVEKALKPFGLKVTQFDTGGDDYVFTISKG